MAPNLVLSSHHKIELLEFVKNGYLSEINQNSTSVSEMRLVFLDKCSPQRERERERGGVVERKRGGERRERER